MRVIVPMAGRGTRLRPHTLTTPKPLLHVAGKPIVQRLVEDIAAIYQGDIEEIAYIIGDFGKEAEQNLISVAEALGAKGTIYYQYEALGTAHAIQQAKDSLKGEVIIAFADTLFTADFSLDRSKDGVIWVKKVEDPKAYGVVTLDESGVINALVEKPQEFVSDLAIIGIYYLKDGENLASEIQYLLDNNIREKGEYQLTNALDNMKNKGLKFVPGEVNEWMDCGNKNMVLDTTEKVLGFESKKGIKLVDDSVSLVNSVIIPPCFIGKNVTLINSVIGPNVSLGDGCVVENSVIRNTSAREKTVIKNAVLHQAMMGTHVVYTGKSESPDLGDYSKF
ncbi:MAG: nucleotidyltransferase [Bacteroidia bacterium]|nr:nucleotidyltransferase [Bacteroidia bacterium]